MNMTRLAQLPLFAGLSEDAQRAIGTAVTEQSFEAGRVVVREGDFAERLTIIDEGTVRVERDGIELAQLGPGATFGEQGVIEKAQRNASVIAHTDVRLMHLEGFDLKRIGHAHPELLERVEQIVAERH
ncbi:unannotated protein [freshwater metagenome]|jgi:CRP-like cAMP-binding protein|uniref:Unannotated protein n=1 Tax=freshwater metagenome TaxID=449393 RepID=A0A6J7HBB3_9ZZZZ|nr:cyclic nucleotide-binding domain-containing protein [Actinomycetota bacterium]